MKRIGWVAVAMAMFAMLAMTACAGRDPVQEYWAERFDYYRSLATTDFEREALADNQISRAEYEEAAQRYVDCMAEKGWAVGRFEILDTGVYGFEEAPGADAVSAECMKGTRAVIEPLYMSLLQDPENRGGDVATVECLKRHGLLPPDYDVEAAFEVWTEDLSSYVDRNDPAVEAIVGPCMLNPTM